MFREELQPSFSDIWYRVGPTRPRLSPHAQITRQTFGAQTVYIVEDPAGGQYYRLSEPAYFFIGMLNGGRTVDDAWQACNAQLGDDAPTQRECVDLLGKLQRFGLLLGEQPLAADMVRQRVKEAAELRFKRTTGKFISINIPVFNPEPMLEKLAPILRVIFSWKGAAVWLIAVISAIIAVIPRAPLLTSQFNGVLDPENLLWLSIMFLALRAWHELGHAAACKAMGGPCTRIGIILMLMILPVPYCDASSSWRFPEVWRRVIVSAGGMIFEIFAASIAALIWALSDPQQPGLVRSLCYNAMVLSGITTIVFNANPLLRYDGYYILSDLTGIANLAQRANETWRYLLERFAFGLRGLRAPNLRSRAEFWTLFTFGALSFPYRLFVTFSLLAVVLPRYFTIGIAVACICASVMLVWPILKGIGYLAAEPRLMGRRARAAGVILGALGIAAIAIGILPVRAGAYGVGTLEAADQVSLRADEDGFITEIHAREGEAVIAGQPLFTLTNTDISTDLIRAQARLERARTELDGASDRPPAEREVAQRALEAAQAEADRAARRVEALTVRSPIAGTVINTDPHLHVLRNLVGRYVTRGGLIADVVTADKPLVRALVSDLDHAYVFGSIGRADADSAAAGIHASIRFYGDAGHVISGKIVRVGPAAQRKLTSEALAAQAGGEVLLDPSDPQQKRTVSPQFIVEVEPTEPIGTLTLGQRARVRLDIEPRPILGQVWRRLRQYFNAQRSA